MYTRLLLQKLIRLALADTIDVDLPRDTHVYASADGMFVHITLTPLEALIVDDALFGIQIALRNMRSDPAGLNDEPEE